MKLGHADPGGLRATALVGAPSDPRGLAACCVDVYSHPIARWLFGDSFHPGGLALTQRVARLAGVGPGPRVLDLGSGASKLGSAGRRSGESITWSSSAAATSRISLSAIVPTTWG